jgi:hypothetical protein
VFATWTVDTKAPTAAIDSHPDSPSSSTGASFTYHSDESKSSFECSLSSVGDPGGFAACPTGGQSYGPLEAGDTYTFKVRATDQAGNQQAGATEFSWEVEGAATAPPPPEDTPDLIVPPLPSPPALPVARSATPNTSILAKPPARTRDRTPTFRFGASDVGARFQCTHDHGRFKPCRSPLTLKRLSPGRHLLRVRAVLGGSPDPSPASFKFTIIGAR